LNSHHQIMSLHKIIYWLVRNDADLCIWNPKFAATNHYHCNFKYVP